MKKYHIITYGCQMNEHDSENIAGFLEKMGYQYVEKPLDADVVVMNTCSVRENADKKFFGVLGQFKKKKKSNPEFILCICGCMPQQEWVIDKVKKQFSWVDIVFGTQNISEFPSLLQKRISTDQKQYSIIENNPHIDEEQMNPKRLYKHKALVNITYGCNNFCTYCIVPYTRGREKSRKLDDVIAEIKCLVQDGVKEVMILGQNVDSYCDSSGNSFAVLIKEINKIEGLERIRFMTSHPRDISDEMIECFKTCEKLCKNIHLPIQSGSDDILKKMNRHYDLEKYLSIVNKLRTVCPYISISTDIIVGFPGETEDDFERTLDVVKNVRYDSAFTFLYSPRHGTPAASYENQIPEEIKHKRFNKLVDLINEISLEKNETYIGKEFEVLVDGYSKNSDNFYSGRTDDFKLVNFKSDKSLDEICGKIVKVLIVNSKTFSLDGVEV